MEPPTDAPGARPLLLVLLLLLPGPAVALPAAPTLGPASHGTASSTDGIQVQEQEVDSRDRVARAVRREGELRIDGRLDEEAWQRAEVVTGFTQREPDEGEPATEPTEVRMPLSQLRYEPSPEFQTWGVASRGSTCPRRPGTPRCSPTW